VDLAGAHLSDATLISRVYLDGDREAFDLLDERYRPKVFNYLYRIVQDFDRAQDLTQDVFLKAYAGIPQLVSFENVPGWLFRIARSSLGMEVRRRRRMKEALSLDGGPPTRSGRGNVMASVIGSDSHRPDRLASRRHLEKNVERAIRRLAPDLQKVVSLCIIQGLPYGKVAEILRIGRQTVGTRLYRARRLMAEYLNAAPDD